MMGVSVPMQRIYMYMYQQPTCVDPLTLKSLRAPSNSISRASHFCCSSCNKEIPSTYTQVQKQMYMYIHVHIHVHVHVHYTCIPQVSVSVHSVCSHTQQSSSHTLSVHSVHEIHSGRKEGVRRRGREREGEGGRGR